MNDLLLKFLGLSPEASEDEITTALEAAQKKLARVDAIWAYLLKLLGLEPTAADADITTALEAARQKLGSELADKVKTLSATVENLGMASAKKEIDLVLERAALEGKVVQAKFVEGPLALSAPQLAALVADLPSTIPLDRRTPHHVQPRGVDSADEQMRVRMNIPKEDWAKFANR